jgi:hypothetical protein
MGPDPGTINLPHARTIVGRLVYYLAQRPELAGAGASDVRDLLDDLEKGLGKYEVDPPAQEALAAAEKNSVTARALADEIVRCGYRGDRLGQCVRNLFECLGYAGEGAERSLACGERPDSPLRP